MKKIGRYDVIGELGRGAMGVVYKASDPTIGRVVAIKVLSHELKAEEEMDRRLEMFMREARAAGRLSHPNIVAVYDAVEDPASKLNYIVMELVPGRDLEKLLASGTPLEASQALDVTRQLAEALDYAHRQNVIHKDLKPANILLTGDGRAKIADFGIAKFSTQVGSVLTTSITGTPSYMSPEQAMGGEVDARTDLFSLGVVLYKMLTGQSPFQGDLGAVVYKIVHENPALPSKLNPKLRRPHDYLALRCLAKDPAKRYASARELLDDLSDVKRRRAPRSEAGFPMSQLLDAEPTRVVERSVAWLLLRRLPATKRKVAAIAGVGALMLLGVLALAIRASRHRAATAQPASSSSLKEQRSTASVVAAGKAPAKLLASSKAKSARVRKARNAGRVIHLVCRHELAGGTLTVSSGTNTIFSGQLKGKRKKGVLGIKGAYAGTLSRSITIPAGVQKVSVRVLSADGALDLSDTVSTASPKQHSRILYVIVNGDRLTLTWGATSGRKS